MNCHTVFYACLLGLLSSFVMAGEADVLAVEVHQTSSGVYRFDVTVKHDDTGWDHYADKWDVLDEQGEVLATRVLHHPHVNEQTFIRSLSGVKIPQDMKKVILRAHDYVHHYGGKTVIVDLP